MGPGHGYLEDIGPEWRLSTAEVKLLEMVGEGATAVVYRGICRGRDVAVKEIAFESQVNWARELRILTMVRHPNVVEFVGVAVDPVLNTAQLLTDFCRGGTAFQLLHESDVGLSWRQKEKMALDVGRAVQYLHSFEPEIVHRDLKSLNLLLEEPVRAEADQPTVRLADFGLARLPGAAAEDGSTMTRKAGTGQWMAPEVFTSDSYGRKVDVYSYGMILYEVICRAVPFQGVALERLGLRVVQGQRPALARVPCDCPEVLSELMVQCWAQEAAQRPDFFEVCGILLTHQRRCTDELQDTAELPDMDDDGGSQASGASAVTDSVMW